MLGSLDLSSTARIQMEEATAAYVEQLDDAARDYLHARGLSEDTVRSSRVGLVGEPLPGHEQYRGRLCVPFLTPSGVVALRFRTLGDDSAKYLSLPGATPRLYGVGAFHTGLPYIAITEGEFDALALTQAGLPAVGVPGANSWQKHYPRCFADYERVYIITDNDVKVDEEGNTLPNPGQQLAHKIAKQIRNGIVITPPENVDVSEWIMRDGPEKVLAKIGLSDVRHAHITQYDEHQEGGVSVNAQGAATVDLDTPPF